MISAEVREEILRRIARAEHEHGVRVLYAVESGSRAWGFASPNSDYDVRFIYAHPQSWYLSLEEQRDVIEYPIVDEIDINGWDLRKALRLLGRSNPAIVEWLQSPLVYVQTGAFHSRALALLPQIYSIEKGIYHYRSMAQNNHRNFLRGEQVLLKKYFYVLRPLLAIRWLESQRTPAPIEFATLCERLQDAALRESIDALVERKSRSLETERVAAIPELNAFIADELQRLENYSDAPQYQPETFNKLNALFRELLAAGPCGILDR